MYDWDDLRIFLTVARLKKLAPAARSLEMDATTISRRMTRLAQKLDSDLFEQVGAERFLTSTGQALFRHAETIEAAALSAFGEVKGERRSLSGQVRLSVAEGFGVWILAPSLAEFHAQHPDIQIDIVTASGFLNPSKREADMAVMLTRPQRGYLSVQKLSDYRLHLYASSDYLSSREPILNLSDLRQHSLVGYVPEFIFTPELDYIDEIDAGIDVALRSSSITIQRRLIISGAGIGVLPDFIAKTDPRLVPVLPQDVEITRSFWLVTHRDMVKLARIKAVAGLLRRQVLTTL